MKKTALMLMIITVASKVLGFAREMTLAYFYGASNISDAYLLSLTIPSVLFGLVATGVATGYIPIYSSIIEKEDEKTAFIFTSNIINILLVVCSVIIILSWIYTEQLVRLFAMGFTDDTFNIAVSFTRILLISMYFTALISILSGYLQIKNVFIIPALVGFPMSIVVIIAIILSSWGSIYVLAIGSVVASIIQFIFIYCFAHKKGFKYNINLNFKDDNIKKLVYIAIPVMLGSSVSQINIMVDKTLASTIVVGGISALNYATKLNDVIQGLFVITVVTVIYPMLSKLVAQNNYDKFKKTITEAISAINLLAIPAMVGMLIFAEPIIELIFARGAFDDQATRLTSGALFYYILGALGLGYSQVLYRAFYSMHNSKTPMIYASIAVIINIVLNLILSKYMGISGLALATSISINISAILLFISLRRQLGPFGMLGVLISFVKITFASFLMGLVSFFCYKFMLSIFDKNLALIIAISSAIVIYSMLVYLLKIKEVQSIINSIKFKINNKGE